MTAAERQTKRRTLRLLFVEEIRSNLQEALKALDVGHAEAVADATEQIQLAIEKLDSVK